MVPGSAAPCLGTVGMALHHKICHTLGGSFDTAACRNPCGAAAAHGRLQRGGGAANLLPASPTSLGGAGRGRASGILPSRLARRMALREFGLNEADLDRAARSPLNNPYRNPRPIDRGPIGHCVQAACDDRRPGSDRLPGYALWKEQHVGEGGSI